MTAVAEEERLADERRWRELERDEMLRRQSRTTVVVIKNVYDTPPLANAHPIVPPS
jgi:hypothetical protein